MHKGLVVKEVTGSAVFLVSNFPPPLTDDEIQKAHSHS